MNVLLTGGSGFLGTGILYYLTDQKFKHTIWLLLRSKKEKSASDRFSDIVKTFPGLQLRLVEGSTTNICMNLPIDIIINCAASVSFTLPFMEAYKQNVESVRYLIHFAQEHSVKKFIHVSTAYVTDYREKTIGENFIDMDPIDYGNTSYFPNTYTHTKCIAEKYIQKQILSKHNKISFHIVRPSIITSALSIPYKGWYVGNNAYIGYTFMLAKGMPLMYPCNLNSSLDLVPVDYVCGKIYEIVTSQSDKTITNAVSPFKQITHREVQELIFRFTGTYVFLFSDSTTFIYLILWYINYIMLLFVSMFSKKIARVLPAVKTINADFQHFTSTTYHFDNKRVNNFQYYVDDMQIRLKKIGFKKSILRLPFLK